MAHRNCDENCEIQKHYNHLCNLTEGNNVADHHTTMTIYFNSSKIGKICTRNEIPKEINTHFYINFTRNVFSKPQLDF